MHEVVRLAGGRVKVPALDRPDFDAVRKQARGKVLEQFAKIVVDPERLLQLAAEAVDRAGEDATDLLKEHDPALNSLAFYTTARSVYYSAGTSRSGMTRAQ